MAKPSRSTSKGAGALKQLKVSLPAKLLRLVLRTQSRSVSAPTPTRNAAASSLQAGHVVEGPRQHPLAEPGEPALDQGLRRRGAAGTRAEVASAPAETPADGQIVCSKKWISREWSAGPAFAGGGA